ncbi:HSPA5 [Symbiodinium natans]|uniref:HSPA5 protein n=1 Tax=Symbiodinium natans TaxID=878477 RepID=A0A812M4F7_9DINO|nr:HSPA5 [Symbiodinium natans]
MQYLLALGGVVVVAGCMRISLVSSILAALGFRGRPQVVGIDLGTTFSVVALKATDGTISIIPDHVTGKQLLPSVVTFMADGKIIVGDGAVENRGRYPQHTIFNAKRFIGRRLGEVSLEAGTHAYHVSANFTKDSRSPSATDLSGPAGFAVAFADGTERWISPVEVGAEVVRHMRRSVSRHLGFEISRVVICVPAKFGVAETKATQESFERAGMKVMRILEEPTAAAVAYNLHQGEGVRHVLVYDIGGGTLDTSLLYMNGNAVSVLSVAGDDHLGGSDFDTQMRRLLESKLERGEARTSAAGVGKESCDSSGLHILAEAVKIRLSNNSQAEAICHSDGIDRVLVVTRAEFEESAAELFGRAMAPVQKVLDDQMMTADYIDDVVLVGGASRMPKLRELLQEFFGPTKRLHTEIDPDITVAWGAASVLD